MRHYKVMNIKITIIVYIIHEHPDIDNKLSGMKNGTYNYEYKGILWNSSYISSIYRVSCMYSLFFRKITCLFIFTMSFIK